MHVRPHKRLAYRCGICGTKRPRYDQGQGRRRWRALDLGTVRAYLEADAPRVSCPAHGVITAAVPWARHGAAHTRFFDDQVGWLAAACSKTTITALMRISWRTVGTIIAPVAGEAAAATDRLAGLRRIGIDEISYKRGHKYLVIVVDHDTGLLIWAAPGRETRTVHAFSGQLGAERCKLLTHLSADGADWISGPAAARAPQAVLCADPFHVVSWATGALDEVRREVWRTARHAGAITAIRHGSRTIRVSSGDAKDLKHARYALRGKPREPHRPAGSQTRLDRENTPLPLARLPAQRRTADRVQTQRRRRQARPDPLAILGSPLPHPRIHRTQEKIRRHLPSIHATLDHGLSNGLIESANTKIRVLTRIAYGFHKPAALIALAMLALGGLRLPLPGR